MKAVDFQDLVTLKILPFIEENFENGPKLIMDNARIFISHFLKIFISLSISDSGLRLILLRFEPLPVECLVLDPERLVLDLERLTLDLERLVLDLERLVLDLETYLMFLWMVL